MNLQLSSFSSIYSESVTYNFSGVALPLDLDGDLVSEEAEPGVDLAHHVITQLVAFIDQLGAALVHQPSQVTHQASRLSPDSKTFVCSVKIMEAVQMCDILQHSYFFSKIKYHIAK